MENLNELMNNNRADRFQYVDETFMAYVDTIIPRSPELARMYNEAQLYGALDLLTDYYVIINLNYYFIPLADPTAELLNILAKQFIALESKEELIYSINVLQSGAFAALSPMNRLLAVMLLEDTKLYYSDLLLPFRDYPGLFSVTSSLNRYTMMGFYSEWYGYGNTRLEEVDDRILEFFPISWEQVGYPGPSYSYIDYVKEYYLINEDSWEG